MVGVFFSSRRRHTRLQGDWSSDVCSSDLGGSLGRAPDILAFYRGEDLVGLAPLYHRRVMRGLLLAHSVQVIGLSWRDSEPLISEYLDVIAAPQDLAAVRHACLRLLLDEPARPELVIGSTARRH